MDNDPVVLLQQVSQNLSQAHNAWQGSSFMRYFAAKLVPQLTEDQVKMRQQILRMGGSLVETEFNECMDRLTAAWLKYREVTK